MNPSVFIPYFGKALEDALSELFDEPVSFALVVQHKDKCHFISNVKLDEATELFESFVIELKRKQVSAAN